MASIERIIPSNPFEAETQISWGRSSGGYVPTLPTIYDDEEYRGVEEEQTSYLESSKISTPWGWSAGNRSIAADDEEKKKWYSVSSEVVACWGWGAGNLSTAADDEEENWCPESISNQVSATWAWSAGNLPASDEDESDEWDFGHCMAQQKQESQKEDEELNQHLPEERTEEEDWNIDHYKVTKGDDAESVTSVTFMEDSFSCVSSIHEEDNKAIIRGSLDTALGQAKTSLEDHSLSMSHIVMGLPEEGDEQSLPNNDIDDQLNFSWWTLSPSTSDGSEFDESMKSPSSSTKRKKKKKKKVIARKEKCISSISAPSIETISKSLNPEEVQSLASPKPRRSKKSKSRSPKRSSGDKKKKKHSDTSSVVSPKSKRKIKCRPNKSKSLPRP